MEFDDMEGDIFTNLAQGNDPVVAILASLVLVLSTVVVAQWRYTINKTVPKWAWDKITGQLELLVDLVKKVDVIIEERLKK